MLGGSVRTQSKKTPMRPSGVGSGGRCTPLSFCISATRRAASPGARRSVDAPLVHQVGGIAPKHAFRGGIDVDQAAIRPMVTTAGPAESRMSRGARSAGAGASHRKCDLAWACERRAELRLRRLRASKANQSEDQPEAHHDRSNGQNQSQNSQTDQRRKTPPETPRAGRELPATAISSDGSPMVPPSAQNVPGFPMPEASVHVSVCRKYMHLIALPLGKSVRVPWRAILASWRRPLRSADATPSKATSPRCAPCASIRKPRLTQNSRECSIAFGYGRLWFFTSSRNLARCMVYFGSPIAPRESPGGHRYAIRTLDSCSVSACNSAECGIRATSCSSAAGRCSHTCFDLWWRRQSCSCFRDQAGHDGQVPGSRCRPAGLVQERWHAGPDLGHARNGTESRHQGVDHFRDAGHHHASHAGSKESLTHDAAWDAFVALFKDSSTIKTHTLPASFQSSRFRSSHSWLSAPWMGREAAGTDAHCRSPDLLDLVAS